jgi:hypothetical protein
MYRIQQTDAVGNGRSTEDPHNNGAAVGVLMRVLRISIQPNSFTEVVISKPVVRSHFISHKIQQARQDNMWP